MPKNITAKVSCSTKTELDAGDGYALAFYADYADGRNKEWAVRTPTLSMTMTVTNEAADLFEAGKAYTLTFTPEEG